MLRLFLTALIICTCITLTHAEVVQKDGKDYILIPADLLFQRQRLSHHGLTSAKPFMVTEDGRLNISDTYQLLYAFDDAKLAEIRQAFNKVEVAFFKHIHDLKQITDKDGVITMQIFGTKDKLEPVIEEFTKTIESLLDDKQKLLLKYFDIRTFSFNDRVIPQSNNATTVVLTPPPKPLDLPEDQRQERIATLKKQMKKLMKGGAWSRNDDYSRINRELAQLGAKGHKASYSVNVSGNGGNSSSSGPNKSKTYLFFERAFNYHKKGEDGTVSDF